MQCTGQRKAPPPGGYLVPGTNIPVKDPSGGGRFGAGTNRMALAPPMAAGGGGGSGSGSGAGGGGGGKPMPGAIAAAAAPKPQPVAKKLQAMEF